MPFTIIRHDITKMEVDAIVNATNAQLAMGGGVCGAIFRAAGQKNLANACNELAPIKTGDAVITPGFNLAAKYIIHAVGPIYGQRPPLESERLLRSAYKSSLELAKSYKCKSIAFPLISSGIYGYPKEEALEVAVETIKDFLENNEMDIYLTIFDKAFFAINQDLVDKIDKYLDENFDENLAEEGSAEEAPVEDGVFSEALLKFIDNGDKTDPEVYKGANISRKLFSEIRSDKGYIPSKQTALALAIALELDLSQTKDLLKIAGYTLSPNQKSDVIVEYFIVNDQFDIFGINNVLFEYDQTLLGG